MPSRKHDATRSSPSITTITPIPRRFLELRNSPKTICPPTRPSSRRSPQSSTNTSATSPNPMRFVQCLRSMAREASGASFILRCVLVPESMRSTRTKYTSAQAHKAVGESSEIPLTYYSNNVVATISLLQIMSEYDCSRLVYSSSATVYGTPPQIPIPETTRMKADSPYGTTKIMCEQIIEDLCRGGWSCVARCLTLARLTARQPSPRDGKQSRCATSSP